MREVGSHLLQPRDEQKMCALAVEGVKFMCCVCVVNPAALLAGMQGLVDKDLAEKQPIDAAYYLSSLVGLGTRQLCFAFQSIPALLASHCAHLSPEALRASDLSTAWLSTPN